MCEHILILQDDGQMILINLIIKSNNIMNILFYQSLMVDSVHQFVSAVALTISLSSCTVGMPKYKRHCRLHM